MSIYNTFVISKFVLGPTKPIDISGIWHDVKEGYYIEEPASELGPCK